MLAILTKVLAKVVDKVLDITPGYLIAGIGIFAALFLFGPDRILKNLRISDLAQNYRPAFAIGFLACVSLSLAYWGERIVCRIRYTILNEKALKKALQYLHTLTEDEKQILRYYIAKQTKTNRLRLTDGVVNGLVTAGILYPGVPATLGICMDYNIRDFAWEYLNYKKSLLIGTTNTFRTDDPLDVLK